jgi:hypothetical protein
MTTTKPHLATAPLRHRRPPRTVGTAARMASAIALLLLLVFLATHWGAPPTTTHLTNVATQPTPTPPTPSAKQWPDTSAMPGRTPGPPAHPGHSPGASPVPGNMPRPERLTGESSPRWTWPLHGRPRVVRPFAPPSTPWGSGHRGVDVAPLNGGPVVAAGPGVVSYAAVLAGRGVVTVQHTGGLRTTYLPVAATVKVGQPVRAGDALGALSPTPSECPPQPCLHWGLLRGETYLNPLLLLSAGPIRLLPHTTDPLGNPAVPEDQATTTAAQAGATADQATGPTDQANSAATTPGDRRESPEQRTANPANDPTAAESAQSPAGTATKERPPTPPSADASAAQPEQASHLRNALVVVVAVGGLALITATGRRPL